MVVKHFKKEQIAKDYARKIPSRINKRVYKTKKGWSLSIGSERRRKVYGENR